MCPVSRLIRFVFRRDCSDLRQTQSGNSPRGRQRAKVRPTGSSTFRADPRAVEGDSDPQHPAVQYLGRIGQLNDLHLIFWPYKTDTYDTYFEKKSDIVKELIVHYIFVV
jgi:hypothetical protein